MNLEELKKEFKKYAKSFDMNDINIELKYLHSLRVMEIARLIAKYEKFNQEDSELAYIIGILHDYSRFTQWTNYKTFNDLTSFDHGDHGVELLFDNNEIEKFNIDKKYYELIYKAIKHHNKYSVPQEFNAHEKLLCELIRDADKLDILYLFGINKNNDAMFKEDNKPISDAVKKDFYNCRLVDRRNLRTESDRILVYFAMAFDLYFKYSYKHLKDKQIIDSMYNNIENKELFKEYYEFMNNFINNKINNSEESYVKKLIK